MPSLLDLDLHLFTNARPLVDPYHNTGDSQTCGRKAGSSFQTVDNWEQVPLDAPWSGKRVAGLEGFNKELPCMMFVRAACDSGAVQVPQV